MELLAGLAKADPLVLFLLLCIIVAWFGGRRFESNGKIAIDRNQSLIKKDSDLNMAVIQAIGISGQLAQLLEQDKDKLAESIAMQAATFSKISDAQIAIKVGVDTLILDADQAKAFDTELRGYLAQMASCDEKLQVLIDKLDSMGVKQ